MACLAWTVSVGAATAAELGSPVRTIDLSCAANHSVFKTASPLATDEPDLVARVVSTAGAGKAFVYSKEDNSTAPSALTVLGSGADAVFLETAVGLSGPWNGTFGGGSSLGASLDCGSSARSATVSYYRRPTVPVTFPESRSSRPYEDWLPFSASANTRIVADVSVTQGAVEIENQVVTSRATIPLDAQHQAVRVFQQPGPQAIYQVTVRPLAVVLSNVTAPAVAQASAASTVRFRADGDTTVTPQIVDGGGTVRRTFPPMTTTVGEAGYVIDGLDERRSPLPDGAYRIVLRSSDGNGGETQQSAPITFDSSIPKATIEAPTSDRTPVLVTVTDPGGVRDLSGEVPGLVPAVPGTVTSQNVRQVRISPPASGWTPGMTVYVRATDNAGNLLWQYLPVNTPAANATGFPVMSPNPSITPPITGATVGTVPSVLASSASTPASMRIAKARSAGVPVSGTATHAGATITVRLRLSSAIARKVRLPRTASSIVVRADGAKRFTGRVTISARVAKALRKRSNTPLTISASGGATLTTSTISLRR